MTKRLIDRRIESAPAESGAEPSRTRPLPPDLLREASRRLGTVALTGAVLWVSGMVTLHLALRAMGAVTGPWSFETMDAVALVNTVASLGLYRYARTTTRDPAFILDVGLGYLVFT